MTWSNGTAPIHELWTESASGTGQFDRSGAEARGWFFFLPPPI
jgi:hypothetical protein